MRDKSKIFFLVAAMLLFSAYSLLAQNLRVYTSAHPDDWQLFMNPHAYHSLKAEGTKVVFIHTTAGDAGSGTGFNNYYLAREEGSLRAIRFMCNTLGDKTRLGTDMKPEKVTVNGHAVQKFSYGKAVAYFLRLPDGNGNGAGYTHTDSASLKKFNEGTIKKISAIDGSTTYISLDDLKKTIASIIEVEAGEKGAIELNIAETDSSINPGDHSDHMNTSLIFQDVAKGLNVVTINFFSEYSTNKKEYNITGDDFLISAGTWGATASGLSDYSHYSTWDSGHNAWIGRQYFRTVTIPQKGK